MSTSGACLWSRDVRGQSGLRSWLCTCQGQEPGLKKEPRRNQRARPAGALRCSAQPGWGLQQSAPAQPTRAVLQDLVRPVQIWVPPCPSPHPFYPPSQSWVPGAWFGAGAGLSRHGCLTALTGLQIPPRLRSRCAVPSARVAPRFLGSGGVSTTSTRPGASLLAETFRLPPHTPRLISQAQESGRVASLHTQLLALQPSPLVLFLHPLGSGRPNGLQRAK